MFIDVDDTTGQAFLHSIQPQAFSDCLVCETDVQIETTLTFSSTTAEYQLFTSNSQLVGHNYSYWTSRCSGKFITLFEEDWSNLYSYGKRKSTAKRKQNQLMFLKQQSTVHVQVICEL